MSKIKNVGPIVESELQSDSDSQKNKKPKFIFDYTKYIGAPLPLTEGCMEQEWPRCGTNLRIIPLVCFQGFEPIEPIGEVDPDFDPMCMFKGLIQEQEILLAVAGATQSNVVYRRMDNQRDYLCNIRELISKDYKRKPDFIQLPPYYKLQSSSDKTLVFESRFESGNLDMAVKVNDNEYNLLLQVDINTKGHTQWFYFSIRNARKGEAIKFNIMNLAKPNSLFNEGMKILVHSEILHQQNGTGWFRTGREIKYFCNGFKRSNKIDKFYYTLTFIIDIPHDNDALHFAYCYPYTYSDLIQDLQKIENDPNKRNFVSRSVLCRTLAGNRCDYLTITNPQQDIEAKKSKAGVFMQGRAHPGESNGSWMMKGVIDFLTGNSKEAEVLRDRFVFKIIPMINIDGVINGNYRCSLAGTDLNRRWKTPSKVLHPEVYYAKRLCKILTRDYPLELIIDFHGHSRKKNIFGYGNNIKEQPEATRLFPFALSKISPYFSFNRSRFKMQKSKEQTLRITLFKETKCSNTYTIESSFCGSDYGEFKDSHYTSEQLIELGKSVCITLLILSEQQKQIQRSLAPGESNQTKEESQQASEIALLLMKELNLPSREEMIKEMLQCSENLNDASDSSSEGSDSCPSDDNLSQKQLERLLPIKAVSKKPKKPKSQENKLSAQSLFKKKLENNLKMQIAQKIKEKCPNCGEDMEEEHKCKKLEQKPRIPSKRKSLFPQQTQQKITYTNYKGIKVSDASTQTPGPPLPQFRAIHKIQHLSSPKGNIQNLQSQQSLNGYQAMRQNPSLEKLNSVRFNNNQQPLSNRMDQQKILNNYMTNNLSLTGGVLRQSWNLMSKASNQRVVAATPQYQKAGKLLENLQTGKKNPSPSKKNMR